MSTFFFSDQQIFYVIRAEILRAFTAFATDTLHEYYSVLKVNPAIAKVPIIVSTHYMPFLRNITCLTESLHCL